MYGKTNSVLEAVMQFWLAWRLRSRQAGKLILAYQMTFFCIVQTITHTYIYVHIIDSIRMNETL